LHRIVSAYERRDPESDQNYRRKDFREGEHERVDTVSCSMEAIEYWRRRRLVVVPVPRINRLGRSLASSREHRDAQTSEAAEQHRPVKERARKRAELVARQGVAEEKESHHRAYAEAKSCKAFYPDWVEAAPLTGIIDVHEPEHHTAR
jgi:hypothetical protein